MAEGEPIPTPDDTLTKDEVIRRLRLCEPFDSRVPYLDRIDASRLLDQFVAQQQNGSGRPELGRIQDTVGRWVVSTFGEATASNVTERALRLAEEVIEACQAVGMTPQVLRDLIGYVYARPPGNPEQELGGVQVTLAALACALRVRLEVVTVAELERIHHPATIARCRTRQSEKRVAGFGITDPDVSGGDTCPACGGRLETVHEVGGAFRRCTVCNYTDQLPEPPPAMGTG